MTPWPCWPGPGRVSPPEAGHDQDTARGASRLPRPASSSRLGGLTAYPLGPRADHRVSGGRETSPSSRHTATSCGSPTTLMGAKFLRARVVAARRSRSSGQRGGGYSPSRVRGRVRRPAWMSGCGRWWLDRRLTATGGRTGFGPLLVGAMICGVRSRSSGGRDCEGRPHPGAAASRRPHHGAAASAVHTSRTTVACARERPDPARASLRRIDSP